MNKMQMRGMIFKRNIAVFICVLCFALSLMGCEGKDAEDSDGDSGSLFGKSEDKKEADPYDDYIHNALEAVKDNGASSASDDGAAPRVPTASSDESGDGKVIYVEKEDSENVPEEVFVSSQEFDEFKSADTATPTPTPDPKTPAPSTFEVGKGQVYIDGKYDTSYASNLLKYINDARTGLNYPAFVENSSLATCANLRAKEITCYLSHYRPDLSKFYSLAPDYYKAEIITIDGANVKDTFDAWLEDPVSRGIIFSDEYGSIGVSNYVCNGLNCIVVSIGY